MGLPERNKPLSPDYLYTGLRKTGRSSHSSLTCWVWGCLPDGVQHLHVPDVVYVQRLLQAHYEPLEERDGAKPKNTRHEVQAETRHTPNLHLADSWIKALCVPSRTPHRLDTHAEDAGMTRRLSPAPCSLRTGKVMFRARVPVL